MNYCGRTVFAIKDVRFENDMYVGYMVNDMSPFLSPISKEDIIKYTQLFPNASYSCVFIDKESAESFIYRYYLPSLCSNKSDDKFPIIEEIFIPEVSRSFRDYIQELLDRTEQVNILYYHTWNPPGFDYYIKVKEDGDPINIEGMSWSITGEFFAVSDMYKINRADEVKNRIHSSMLIKLRACCKNQDVSIDLGDYVIERAYQNSNNIDCLMLKRSSQ